MCRHSAFAFCSQLGPSISGERSLSRTHKVVRKEVILYFVRETKRLARARLGPTYVFFT